MLTLDETIPTIELHDFDESTLRILQALQSMLLRHPIAFQAAFNALIAEGRMFGETPEGRELKTKLENSSLVQQLRYVFDLTTFSLLERDASSMLPSAYIDTLFMLGGNERSDHLLDRLFRQLTPK
jgi:hypothetical protein